MKDIEIANKCKMESIQTIAKKIGLNEDDLEQFGKYKAKISDNIYKNSKKKDGKLILVTAMSPTMMGEGKTTVSIGIADAMNKLNKKVVLALREPSMGPVFGMKGGATGGGYSQILPMEDINLHFTGDIHAITSANNLLSSMIDNHIYFGNELEIEKVAWQRCLDLNDRALRNVITGIGEKNIERKDVFSITAASEVMAILCLAKNINDLKIKLGNILIGYTKEGNALFARDINAEGAMTVLLKDAIKPNLVQTLEKTPALIHGGPFANIAHGCNSIIATKTALKLGEYVITEAGFGADLGAEKFLDIKCREAKLVPSVVVCVATLKALKFHGGTKKENILKEDLSSLSKGLENLYKHVDNLGNKFGLNVVVAINKYDTDTEKEINFIKEELLKREIACEVSEAYAKGGAGAIDLAKKILTVVDNNKVKKINFTYDLEDSIIEKSKKLVKNIYGANGVVFSKESLDSIKMIEKLGFGNLPICIAKTQYSFSDNPNILDLNESYTIDIRQVHLNAGAGFVVMVSGKIFTMPGLPKVPAAEGIDIKANGETVGIF